MNNPPLNGYTVGEFLYPKFDEAWTKASLLKNGWQQLAPELSIQYVIYRWFQHGNSKIYYLHEKYITTIQLLVEVMVSFADLSDMLLLQ